jgi:hypothetical protein
MVAQGDEKLDDFNNEISLWQTERLSGKKT